MVGRGLLGGLASTVGVTVYSGTQPSAATIASNWTSYNSSNASCLIHFQGVGWTHPIDGTTTFSSITTFPASTAAINSGIGEWCIVWSTAVTPTALAGATIPSTSFIIGPVSTLAGNGIVRFNPSVTFVALTPYTIADGTISVSST